MMVYEFRRLSLACLIGVAISLCFAAACQDGSDRVGRANLVVPLTEFLQNPRKHSGSFILVRGVLERTGGGFRVSKFDADFHSTVTMDSYILVEDELLASDPSPGNAADHAGCLGEPVEVAGRLGKISNKTEFGIVHVETIYVSEKGNPDGYRGRLCYSNYSGAR